MNIMSPFSSSSSNHIIPCFGYHAAPTTTPRRAAVTGNIHLNATPTVTLALVPRYPSPWTLFATNGNEDDENVIFANENNNGSSNTGSDSLNENTISEMLMAPTERSVMDEVENHENEEDDDLLDYEEDEEDYEYDDDDELLQDLLMLDGIDSDEEFNKLNDQSLLELLGLPDIDSTSDESSEIRRVISTSSREDHDDFFLMDDPDPAELLELEKNVESMFQNEERDAENIDGETTPEDGSSARSGESSALEQALLQGVVPAGAGVGSGCLPGDYGFDPFGLANWDAFPKVQKALLNLLPAPQNKEEDKATSILTSRPTALILRDYREAEIRHGRLAMLAAILWPLQEIQNRLFIPAQSIDFTVVYGGITLPYLSLFMMLLIMLLGYLDIYANVIKEEEVGDAFMPGECFWDPLRILDSGAPEEMKRKMQERELNNGRAAMVAVFFYVLEEAVFRQPLVSLPFNQMLFEPAFQIPAVQEWLDRQFTGPSTIMPDIKSTDFVDSVNIMDQL